LIRHYAYADAAADAITPLLLISIIYAAFDIIYYDITPLRHCHCRHYG